MSMYFDSTGPLNREHLKKLKRLVKRTGTPWLSDHLCWGSVDGRYTHDLLPMPYTMAVAKHTAKKIREVRDFVETPICVENVSSYAEFHQSEMTEWEFLSEVVERADCGILLDVNNIYVSSQNHDFDPYEYLNSVPHHRVGQIHIAGHSKFTKYILDRHDHPVIDPVWKLYEHNSTVTVASARQISFGGLAGKRTIVIGQPRFAPVLVDLLAGQNFRPPAYTPGQHFAGFV